MNEGRESRDESEVPRVRSKRLKDAAMTAEKRLELLDILKELSDGYPDWRFGQMVTNLATLARGPEVESIWDAEDAEFIDAARQLLENRRAVASPRRATNG